MTGLPHEIRRLSVWTSEDTRNALLTSLIPAGAGWCILAKDKDYVDIIKAGFRANSENAEFQKEHNRKSKKPKSQK